MIGSRLTLELLLPKHEHGQAKRDHLFALKVTPEYLDAISTTLLAIASSSSSNLGLLSFPQVFNFPASTATSTTRRSVLRFPTSTIRRPNLLVPNHYLAMEGAIRRHWLSGQATVENDEENELPEPIQLAGTRFKLQDRQFSPDEPTEDSTFSQDGLEKVVVLNDPGNSIIVTLLTRCHRRYTNDKPLTNDSYYVGINETDFTPAFTRSVAMSSLKNNVYENIARSGCGMTVPCLIIPPVDMLRPNQVLFLKYLSREEGYGSKFRDVPENEIAEYKKQQQDAFSAGHACPVLVASAEIMPDYAAISDTREDKWRHFRMMMPKMQRIRIPVGLMNEIDAFLGKYELDIVSPCFALILAIIYHDCYHALDLGAEKGMILYGPHYFRIHEEFKLSAYVHIFRAVDYFYGNDKSLGAFMINDGDIDTDLVFKYIDEMGLEEEDWLEIVPPSWEGSLLTMPLNHGPRAPPSRELSAMLMMPDIYTLGFAGYTNGKGSNLRGIIRDTLMHGLFVPKHIQSDPDLWRPIADGEISLKALEPYQDQLTHQIWSAPKIYVRSPWPEVVTIDPHSSPDIEDTQVSPEVQAEDRHIGNPSGSPISHDENIRNTKEYYKVFIKTIRQGQNAGLIDKSVTIGPDGCLTWPGLGNQYGIKHKLPGGINIQKLIAEYDAADADRISEIDRRILQRLFETDLADGKPVAKCARELKALIRIDDVDLGNTKVREAFEDCLGPTHVEKSRIWNEVASA
ncbi:hypothetical protein CSIM01_05941 [Colletotrichum simmondsii]|uniref:Uncharacterized protein n=1 Tax=Colletotrichum simmondsii TaxID=703756 RepID=A0A135T3V0_9PEZI|nr:hypothetical protein CSIM01_05941 [Colletotrichum simmondsii]